MLISRGLISRADEPIIYRRKKTNSVVVLGCKSPEAATRDVVQKKVFLKISGLRPVTLLKKGTLEQVFSCEFFKNTFFYRTPPDDCFLKSTFSLYTCKSNNTW